MADGGGPRGLLIARIAGDCGDNADEPKSRKKKVRKGFSAHSKVTPSTLAFHACHHHSQGVADLITDIHQLVVIKVDPAPAHLPALLFLMG